MKVEYRDGCTYLDGIKLSISEAVHRKLIDGLPDSGKARRIGMAVLSNLSRYPEFKDF